jgi:CHAT domain-containing protein
MVEFRLNDGRQQVYLDLIQALLNCPQGEETALLACHPELVDEELVTTALATAQMLTEQDGQDADSTALWLMEFAENLARSLGVDLDRNQFLKGSHTIENPDRGGNESQQQLLIEVLQSIAKNDDDPQSVYLLLRKHLEFLNTEMSLVIRAWANSALAETDLATQLYIAGIISEFGNLIQQFPLGNKATNMELSITCYDVALEIFTFEKFPKEWAGIQNSLAVAYSHRIRGDRAENMERAIEIYKSAFLFLTKESFPNQWAATKNNLATAYSERIRGDRAENIERAIESYDSALMIRDQTNSLVDRAMTQNNLANAYSERIYGDRSENLEVAVSFFQAALEVFTKTVFPIQWANTQNNLANVYLNRIRGNREENLEIAISCYQAVLGIFTKTDFPIQWAGTQNNLANAYSECIRGDRGENLEIAISCYYFALEVRTKEDFPIQWANTQNNLANAYSDRIKGDRGENLETAISCYYFALEIYTKYDFPIDWAMTQNNLATAYSERIRGDRAENIEQAISSYYSALEVRIKEYFPIDWAMTQNNLATAYLNRIRGDRRENLEIAISCYYFALEIYTKEYFPIDWAMTQNNLAACFGERIKGDRGENLEIAISCYEAALEVRTKTDLPIQWATTRNNLARAYFNRIRGDRKENLQRAIECYESALMIATPSSLPIDCLQSARSLGDIYFTEGEWHQAICSYETAMQAVETSRSWSVNDEERQRVLRTALSVYENAIQCAINRKDYKLAIEYTERVRGRQLVELMASKDLYSDAQVPAEIQAYLAEYQQLNQTIKDLHVDSTGKMSSRCSQDNCRNEDIYQSREHIQQAEARKQFLYNQIRTYDPILAGQIGIAPIFYSDIQKLITNSQTAILIFYSTDNDTCIFILKQNQEPELITCFGQGYNNFQNWLIENWLIPYNQGNSQARSSRTEILNSAKNDLAVSQAVQKNSQQARTWLEQMPQVLAEVSDRLQINQLITQHLEGIQELVLVPHLLLHQIPFSALPIVYFDSTQTESLAPAAIKESLAMFGEKFIIRSIPSCQILQYCQQRPDITDSVQGLVEDADETLMGARYEGCKIAEICEVKEGDRLRGKTQATIANYRQLLGRVNRLHSSHHAGSRLDNPLESALMLADGMITLGDLLLGERYPNLDEVFLSACETHVGQINATDDVVTIATGFLCAGARSVISTLWNVSDLVTTFFDIFYHQERREGYNCAISLKRAQIRLKNLSGKEFRINHYPEFKQFLDLELEPKINEIDQRIQQLNIIKTQATGEEEKKILEELTYLRQHYHYLKNFGSTLDRYSQEAYPFASPYFWAGFICQGMA